MTDSPNKFKCDPDSCAYHLVMTEIVTNLKKAVGDIVKAQSDLRESVVQLTEAFKGVERLEKRIDILEQAQRDKDKEQDGKIEFHTKQIYKWMGGLALLGVVIGPIISVVLTIIYNHFTRGGSV